MSWTFLGSHGKPEEEKELRNEYRDQVLALHAYVIRLLGGDRDKAEDIVQESMLRCWRSYGCLGDTLLRPLLFRVARNLVIDAHRSSRARPQEVNGMFPADLDFAETDGVDSLLTSMVITEALKDLSPAHREALVTVYFLRASIQDASVALDLPPGTVKSRVYYGLRSLRKTLESHGLNSVHDVVNHDMAH